MQLGPFSLILFGIVLVALAWLCDLVIRHFWKAFLPMRLYSLTTILGIGLWLVSAFAIADQLGRASPEFLAGLAASAPSIVIGLFIVWVIWGRRNQTK